MRKVRRVQDRLPRNEVGPAHVVGEQFEGVARRRRTSRGRRFAAFAALCSFDDMAEFVEAAGVQGAKAQELVVHWADGGLCSDVGPGQDERRTGDRHHERDARRRDRGGCDTQEPNCYAAQQRHGGGG
jgi:hypothetical protein